MSDFGLQLINDYNLTVASMDDVNYTLRRSGTITNSEFSSGGPNVPSSMFIDVEGMNCPIVFFKSTSSSQRISQIPSYNPGTNRQQINIYKWWNLNIGTMQYYIFDRWIPPERSDFGIQIFDGSGSIIFDGGWKFLKLRDVIWLDPGYPNHQSHGSGANWSNVGNVGTGDLSVAMPICRKYVYMGGSTFGNLMGECVHMTPSGDVFCSVVDLGQFLDAPIGEGFVGGMRSQVMIADVSNLPTSYNP